MPRSGKTCSRSLLMLVLLLLALPWPCRAQGLLLRGVLSGGSLRWYRVHVPPGYVPGVPAPVVLGFHGGGGNATQFAASTGLMATADQHGFLAVFPEGTGLQQGPPFLLETWNAGNCCGTAQSSGVDDVGFVGDLLDDLAQNWSVDPARVFATGLSNGGMLCYRLAAELPDRVAAVAPVEAALGVSTTPTRPVALMAFHGALDTNVPFAGGVGSGISGVNFQSQPASLAPFLLVNQAVLPTGPAVIIGQALRFEAPAATGADIYYWWLLDQAHSWPGQPSAVNPSLPFNTDIDPNQEMWTFFAAHPRLNLAQPVGAGCGALAPSLRSTLPVLGQTLVVDLVGAPPGVPGTLFAGVLLPVGLGLPGGCTLDLNPVTLTTLAPLVTDNQGSWSYTLPLPAAPSLIGLEPGLQAALLPPGPSFLSLTNALHLRLGF